MEFEIGCIYKADSRIVMGYGDGQYLRMLKTSCKFVALDIEASDEILPITKTLSCGTVAKTFAPIDYCKIVHNGTIGYIRADEWRCCTKLA